MKVRCPAKINLYLRILGKRPDGFHELETLMCPVSIFDEMEFENGPADVELQIEGADIPAGEDNLVVRAVRLLQEATGLRNGVRIRLRKQIPVGGGLAGGSSNAALTLRALNTFWKAGLSEAQLGQAAAKLGSDINFFLQDGPAICRGRGELVEPVELAGEWQALLINPGFGVPTPWAYQTYAARPQNGPEGRELLCAAGRDGVKREFRLRNDLEPAVFSKYLWIEEARRWLGTQPGVGDAMMSGSGATVFALVRRAEDLPELERRARLYFGEKAWIQPVALLTKGLGA